VACPSTDLTKFDPSNLAWTWLCYWNQLLS